MRTAAAIFFAVFALQGCASSVGSGLPDASNPGSDAASTSDVSSGCRLPTGGFCATGQTCPAGDGCNQCTCSASTGLACTEIACARTCMSSAECAATEICSGPPGCDTVWTCIPAPPCAAVESTFCGCDGQTFSTPSSCAGRIYAHEGPCAMPTVDAGACAASGAFCNHGAECCTGYCSQQGAVGGRCAVAPPDTIACDTLLCDANREYCEISYSDVPTPDSVRCVAIPAACSGRARCDCVSPPWAWCHCEAQPDGTLRYACPGG